MDSGPSISFLHQTHVSISRALQLERVAMDVSGDLQNLASLKTVYADALKTCRSALAFENRGHEFTAAIHDAVQILQCRCRQLDAGIQDDESKEASSLASSAGSGQEPHAAESTTDNNASDGADPAASTAVRWGDIAGCDQVKEAFRDSILLPLLLPGVMRGIRSCPRNFLMTGPPGLALHCIVVKLWR